MFTFQHLPWSIHKSLFHSLPGGQSDTAGVHQPSGSGGVAQYQSAGPSTVGKVPARAEV